MRISYSVFSEFDSRSNLLPSLVYFYYTTVKFCRTLQNNVIMTNTRTCFVAEIFCTAGKHKLRLYNNNYFGTKWTHILCALFMRVNIDAKDSVGRSLGAYFMRIGYAGQYRRERLFALAALLFVHARLKWMFYWIVSSIECSRLHLQTNCGCLLRYATWYQKPLIHADRLRQSKRRSRWEK